MQMNFNAKANQMPYEGNGGGFLPEANYKFRIMNGELKKGEGWESLNLEIHVDEGALKGRKIFVNYCLENSANEMVSKIGRGQLSSLCMAVGIENLRDVSQLFGKRFFADFKMSKPGKKLDKDGKPKRYSQLAHYTPVETLVEPDVMDSVADIFNTDISSISYGESEDTPL